MYNTIISRNEYLFINVLWSPMEDKQYIKNNKNNKMIGILRESIFLDELNTILEKSRYFKSIYIQNPKICKFVN